MNAEKIIQVARSNTSPMLKIVPSGVSLIDVIQVTARLANYSLIGEEQKPIQVINQFESHKECALIHAKKLTHRLSYVNINSSTSRCQAISTYQPEEFKPAHEQQQKQQTSWG